MSFNKESVKPIFAIVADWIIPMDEAIPLKNENSFKQNIAVVVSDRNIIDLVETHELFEKYPEIETIQLPGMALMPGFVNAHTHAAMSLLRGFSDDLTLERWLNDAIWPAEEAFVDDKFVYEGTELAIAEMIRSGTTCFQDMYFMPDQIAKAVSVANHRANIGLMVVESPNVWAQNAEQCINKALQVNDRFKHYDNLSFSFAPHACYTISNESLGKVASLSFELNLNVHIHLHETKEEVDSFEKRYNTRPFNSLNNLGLLSPQLNAVHMTQLTDEEITQLASTGTHVIHCPQSNMKLGSGVCPIGKLIDNDVNFAIGTDGAASNNDLDMLAELQSAVLQAKSGDPAKMTAYQALYAATMGGAKALGLESKIGSIEIGKEADLIAIDLDRIETLPIYNPVSQIVYSASRDQITHLWVAGKQLLKDRKLTTLDYRKLKSNAKNWQEKIKSIKSEY